jgi:serine/threonine protein kinase HipA of HipAB toxin-antitoxin module
VPGRYVRAVEDFACARVLMDEGPGQNRALGSLYSSRFESAVQRLRKRVNQIRQQRTATFGGQSGTGSTPYARLPQSYPEGA